MTSRATLIIVIFFREKCSFLYSSTTHGTHVVEAGTAAPVCYSCPNSSGINCLHAMTPTIAVKGAKNIIINLIISVVFFQTDCGMEPQSYMIYPALGIFGVFSLDTPLSVVVSIRRSCRASLSPAGCDRAIVLITLIQ